MKIAILGATSQIAKDFIKLLIAAGHHQLFLYARRPAAIVVPYANDIKNSIGYIGDYASFATAPKFDAVINFVGVGNPVTALSMGSEIFDVTQHYDQLAINYIRAHPQCRYIFLSSGAAYGGDFERPVDRNSKATLSINKITPQDWYGVAKLYAESRHRAYSDLPIIDIRIFNYFSSSQDLRARFLICDILRSIRDRMTFRTSSVNIVRDYISQIDFYNLIEVMLNSTLVNLVVDAYSLSPVDKYTILTRMKECYGLVYEFNEDVPILNATGVKSNYYSLNHIAYDFGYRPTINSIDSIVNESRALLSCFAN
jgi:nucleoside-diphosphate-sugar epimerase